MGGHLAMTATVCVSDYESDKLGGEKIGSAVCTFHVKVDSVRMRRHSGATRFLIG
jgi:hypothetical protein